MRTDCEGSVREPQCLQTAEPTSSSQTVAEPHSLHLTDMQGEENEETAEIEKQERDYPIVVSPRPHSIFAIKQINFQSLPLFLPLPWPIFPLNQCHLQQ